MPETAVLLREEAPDTTPELVRTKLRCGSVCQRILIPGDSCDDGFLGCLENFLELREPREFAVGAEKRP